MVGLLLTLRMWVLVYLHSGEVACQRRIGRDWKWGKRIGKANEMKLVW
jgi:hypothetical protein